MTLRYDADGINCHDTESMIKQLPQVKRRDAGTSAVQAFFTLEEKEMIKNFCDRMGWDASHFIRCLALGYIAANAETNDQ
ncbi:hypothetical protein NIES22_70620 (plasmid) [Calothrix brevissima NIES-22]|nr:hypothetical protein NIES22_70620 [Calothrix brevissima NIES-22]